MTKFVVLFSLMALALSSAWEFTSEMMETSQICMNQTGLTTGVVENYKPGEDEPTEEMLCFIKCIFAEMGFIDDKGRVCVKTMREKEFIEGDDETKEKIYECVAAFSGSVNKCKDVAPLEACFVDDDD